MSEGERRTRGSRERGRSRGANGEDRADPLAGDPSHAAEQGLADFLALLRGRDAATQEVGEMGFRAGWLAATRFLLARVRRLESIVREAVRHAQEGR